MGKISLFPQQGQFYKANLHCHSTVSDGRCTPQQLKEAYKARGYQILAYSDHFRLVPHMELADPDFLPLTAVEIGANAEDQPWPYSRTCHINFFSKDPYRTQFVEYEQTYDPEKLNQMIQRAVEDGFLAQYNHPGWSYQDSREFLPLKGIFAFEIYNHGCELEMCNGYGLREYEQYCRAGNRCGCVATDDNHDAYPFGNPSNDSFGGFTMIKARDLTYDAVMEALENQAFYASTGPIISDLYWEDGNIAVSCSPCAHLYLHTDSRFTDTLHSFGDHITKAELKIPEGSQFVWLECVDAFGRRAVTRCYYLDSDLKAD